MMKATIHFLLVMGMATVTYGQTNYRNIEDFREGTVLQFRSCKTDSLDGGAAGMNAVWDFSKLDAAGDTITQWIINPGEAPEGRHFPDADLAEKNSDETYVFLKKDETRTYLSGFIDEKSKIKINYPEPVLIAQRPFSFGEKVTEPYSTAYTVNSLNFSGKGSVTIEADGFGTLILPNHKYENVLRIKIVQTQSDVLQQYNTKNDLSTTTYVWFDPQHSSALLKMTETISRYHTERTVAYLLEEKNTPRRR